MKKILILTANPGSTSRLRLDQEVRDIEEGLRLSKNRSDFEIVPKWAVRPRDIQRAMLDENPQIVHFSGHGEGAEGLAFEDNAGSVQLVSGGAIASLFELFADQVECVLLNGCYSKVQAEAIVQQIDYVIGMKQAISDVAAIEFAVAFYDALGAGRSYEFAYKLARNAVQLNIPSQGQTSTRKFTPVDVVEHLKGEHLIPILLKKVDYAEKENSALGNTATEIELQHQKDLENLKKSLIATESAGQARIEILDRKIAEEENKLQETVTAHVREALEWLKKNDKNLSLEAKEYAVTKHPGYFEPLSEQEQDDFRWEVEKYIEAIYFSILSGTYDLLDEPVINPSLSFPEIYQAAFEFIKKKIPSRLQDEAQKLLSKRFDYLFSRLFI